MVNKSLIETIAGPIANEGIGDYDSGVVAVPRGNKRLVGVVGADEAVTVNVWQGADPKHVFPKQTLNAAIAADTPTTFSIEIVAKYVRAQVLNGATPIGLQTGVIGNDNALRWSQRDPAHTSPTIALVDPGAPSQALSVDVTDDDVVVNLATNGASAIISTAQEVLDAVVRDADANAVLHVENLQTSDGTGVVVAVGATAVKKFSAGFWLTED